SRARFYHLAFPIGQRREQSRTLKFCESHENVQQRWSVRMHFNYSIDHRLQLTLQVINVDFPSNHDVQSTGRDGGIKEAFPRARILEELGRLARDNLEMSEPGLADCRQGTQIGWRRQGEQLA